MTLYLDTRKGRIVCLWREPTRYIMNKRPVVIERSKYIWARITKRGRVSKTDRKRYRDHPMFGLILRFSREIQTKGVLGDETGPCAVCGQRQETLACYDAKERSMTWLCREHVDRLAPGGPN